MAFHLSSTNPNPIKDTKFTHCNQPTPIGPLWEAYRVDAYQIPTTSTSLSSASQRHHLHKPIHHAIKVLPSTMLTLLELLTHRIKGL